MKKKNLTRAEITARYEEKMSKLGFVKVCVKVPEHCVQILKEWAQERRDEVLEELDRGS